MFTDMETNRILNMSPQEERWFENIKKAVYDSDMAIINGTPHERCIEELVKAVDVAKNLRESLQGQPVSKGRQKERFIEFIELEVPSPEQGGMKIPLTHSETGKVEGYSFAKLVYDIRCMIVHENDNLDASSKPNYHICLDWTMNPRSGFFGSVTNGTLSCSGGFIAMRLREILAKFVTGVQSTITFHTEHRFEITIRPPLGSIRPKSILP